MLDEQSISCVLTYVLYKIYVLGPQNPSAVNHLGPAFRDAEA